MIDSDLTPEQRAELGDLRPLVERLSAHDLPEPDSARLLATLTPMLAKPAPRQGVRDWLGLAWSQTRLLEAPFWWASLLLALLGLVWGFDSGGMTLVLLFLSPLIAVFGVDYIFRPATRTLWELEKLSRYQPFELLYARLAVILTLNVALALVLLVATLTQDVQIVLWLLLLLWFGPMVGLMGLALFCTIRWSTLAGLLMPMVAWGAMIVLGWRETVLNTTLSLQDLSSVAAQIVASNTLLLWAIAALIGGIVLVYESSRQAVRWG